MNQDTSAYKILIIEDNSGDLLLIQDYLDEYFKSYNQTAAKSFSNAKEILSSQKNHFDIILLDLSLPDLDGMNLVDAMIPLALDTPLILLTGYSDIHFSMLTLSRGVSDYMLKDDLTAFSLYKSIIHNIERKKYIQEIETSQKKYSNLFQLSPQPLIIYCIDNLSILDVNEAACNLYGYTTDEFLRLSIKEILPEQEYSNFKKEIDKIKNLKSTETYKGLAKHQKKDGEVFTVEIYSNAASYEEQNIRICLISDVSERVRYIKKIEGQNERLKEIAWIQSHVVRAPLARIMGLIDLMSNTQVGVNEKEKQYISQGILDSAHELDNIIMEITQKANSFRNE
ncbi:MAG: PAS domain S-box protein [Maribacter sp.]